MNKVLMTIFLLSSLTFACRDYDIIIGESCYTPHRSATMSGWGENIPSHLEEGERLQFQGTYAFEPYGQVGLVRQFDRRKGWSYVILMETLPLEEGTLVAVRGSVAIKEQPVRGTKRINRMKMLHVEAHQVLCDTQGHREKAKREYGRIRERLQKKISMPGSRLQLAEEPQWRVDWLRGEETIVVAAHCYDLMYAAEAQFLFEQESQQLQAIYFQEWFKGE